MRVGIYEKALPSSLSWPERLASARDAGFDFLELSIDESDARLARLDWSRAERAEVHRAVAHSGLPIASLALSGQRRYPMGSRSPAVRRKSLEMLRKAVDLACNLDARVMLVPGYDVFYEPADDGTRARFLDGLRRGVEWAGQARVVLALENADRSITSIGQAMRYVSDISSPWLQVYGDIGNLSALGYDVLAELEAGAGHLAAVHAKDTRPGEFRDIPLGRGTVPFVEAFRKLWQTGFAGPIVLETWGGDEADALEVVAAARAWIRARIDDSRGELPGAPPAAPVSNISLRESEELEWPKSG